jgi:hypothetical protein
MATTTRALEAAAIEQKMTTTKTLRKAGRDASSGLSWLLQPKTTTTKKNHQVSCKLYIRT